MKKMGRQEITKKRSGSHKYIYKILNAIIGTIVFVVIYKIWLEKENNFVWIFLTLLISGIFVSWTLRLFCKYYQSESDLQFIISNLLIGIFYAIIVWFHVFNYLINKFPVLFELIIVIIFVKFFIFLLSDYISDSITFGG